jgi:DNA repair protein RadA/Sms
VTRVAKTRRLFVCTECGTESTRWEGRCAGCEAWNSLEERVASPGRRSRGESLPAATVLPLGEVGREGWSRWPTGIGEFDIALGGGIVPGSIVLVGGEPGIGKSTLLLQVAAGLEERGVRTLYASGEESPQQVALRAERLNEAAARVPFVAASDLDGLLSAAAALSPSLLVVDSIQTLFTREAEGVPGSVVQVRECAARLQRWAKESGTAVFLVGHVTKGGGLAGPKALEHVVDAVLLFEGDGGLEHRVLRATKNRFGSVDEIGVFRMTEAGLVAVENPSELFVGNRGVPSAGSAVTAVMEGSRPLLVEVQALAARSAYGSPQRVTSAFDPRRLALILAVLERRAGVPFSGLDVFVNVTGGVRLTETASDLAIAAALLSSVRDRPLPPDTLFVGEIGLSGEVRPVRASERRLGEASRLGFRGAAIAPPGVRSDLQVTQVASVGELMERFLG